MTNLYTIKPEYIEQINILLSKNSKHRDYETLYARVDDFQKLRFMTENGKQYLSLHIYDENKEFIDIVGLMCDYNIFSPLNKPELYTLVKEMERVIETVTSKNYNDATQFIPILKNVYDECLRLQNYKV